MAADLSPCEQTRPVIFLNEEKANVVPAGGDEPQDTAWYLDTGVSNRMTGDLAVFTELDMGIVGTVRFGDRSVVHIEGRDTVAFSIDGATASGFIGIYDVPHFIKTLKYDVRIAMSVPDIITNGKTKKLKAYQIRPPRDAPVTWYTTVALEKMKSYGAIYLTPFSHRLAEDINDPEIQRLRCRVNYHALRFKPNIMKTSSEIVNKLRSEGHFMSIHLRFEMDMLAFAG
ncbi:unnamed protein product [Triticum turgidum subsp. durum]|uniref:O-fucosyltransferase family protein n=1 Tax=Triticum turgidum subsp. durum TaxID=4567 RepID=A0A9R0SCD7_TRITD|nr:unnamed protein product [Triticum turgidum subsp. durum]